MSNKELKDSLTKLAQELKATAEELREANKALEKKAADSEVSNAFTMGTLGRPAKGENPLVEFCLS